MTGGRKAYYRCCVPKCGQTSSLAPELCFHRIVREPIRREFWLANMKCTEADVTNSSRICGDHFTYYDYEDFEANRLRKIAIPTLFTWEPIYTCKDVSEAMGIVDQPEQTGATNTAEMVRQGQSTADTIEIDDDEDVVAAETDGEDNRNEANDTQESGFNERFEYEQLLTLVSVSERLENAQSSIASELAEMQRVQRRQDRLLDSTLDQIMKPEFPLPISEAQRKLLMTLRAAAILANGEDLEPATEDF